MLNLSVLNLFPHLKGSVLACLLAVLALILPAKAFSQDAEISDPIEGFNRGIFWFNDQVDIFVLEPVAQGYDYITPQFVQTGVGNFFENLAYPKYLVSDLVQLKFGQAAEHTGRFLINSVLGVAGLFDVATDMGLEHESEDFGIALAYNNVPAGPYLVLPFLGPSNLRDGIGKVVDHFLDPVTILGNASGSSSKKTFLVTSGIRALDIIDTRAGLLEAVESAKESSVDYYLFIQGAYYQHRRGVLYDGNPPDDEYVEEDAPFEDP